MISLFEILKNSIDSNILTNNLKKINHLNEFIKFSKYIKQSEYIIGSSASLVLYGLKESNDDIDICLSKEALNRLIKQKLVNIIEEERGHKIISGNLDFGFLETNHNIFNLKDLKDRGYVIVDGLVFQNINGLKYFYNKLVKLYPTKDKFKERLNLIKKYEQSKIL